MAHKLIKNCAVSDDITFIIKRMPQAKVFLLRRTVEGEALGFKREGGTAEVNRGGNFLRKTLKLGVHTAKRFLFSSFTIILQIELPSTCIIRQPSLKDKQSKFIYSE